MDYITMTNGYDHQPLQDVQYRISATRIHRALLSNTVGLSQNAIVEFYVTK
jgi:fibronectin type 3 domain-containing protein